MKKILLLLVFFISMAGKAEPADNHNFFTSYDPTSQDFVYTKDSNDTSATGDQVAVNTYNQKTIQITGVTVGENITIRIEGRSRSQVNTAAASGIANFAVLDVVNFGASSADTTINQIIDVTEYVDFLRVGIKNDGVAGVSAIDIEGIFTNVSR